MENIHPVQYLSFRRENASQASYACYSKTMTSRSGIWLGDNPFSYAVPLFIFQVILAALTTHIVVFFMRPLRLPRYISEIIAGIMLGPSAIGRSESFTMNVFPLRSLVILDVFAHIGLIFSVFSVGVEIDLEMTKRARLRSCAFGIACLASSFTIGSLSSFAIHPRLHEDSDPMAFTLFLGVVLSTTTFSVLVRMLAELKLVGTDVGRLTLSSAILSNGCMWILLFFSIVFAQSSGDIVIAILTLFSWIALLMLTSGVLKPVVAWVIRRTPEGEPFDDFCICSLLVGAMVWAFISDCLGTHAMYGAFVYGLVIPNGSLGQALVEKVENFVTGLLMPLFFLISGLRTDLYSLKHADAAVLLVLAALLSAVAKVAGGAALATVYRMPIHDGVSLGLLMNTKGVTELLVLNIARNKMVIGDQTFTVLVFMVIVVAAIVSPLQNTIVKPSRRLASYKRRSIQWPNPDSELRLLLCIHSPRQVSALIALLDVSHPTKRSPFFVYALHLIELASRASAMLVVNYTAASSSSSSSPTSTAAPTTKDHNHMHGHNRLKAQSDHIFHAFESYEQHAGGVSVQFLTSISSYTSMHEDIVAAAEDKQAAAIILPFHKQQTIDGSMQVHHPALRALNQHVLASSPCTVGILVDRGLASHRLTHRVMLLFFGGPDDRECLALASRMAGHQEIKLVVLRFIHSAKSPSSSFRSARSSPNMERAVNMTMEEDRELWLDNKCVEDFKARWGMGTVNFEEMMVSNAEETVETIRELDGTQDLFIVGKGQGVESPLTAGLTEWSECPELGPIGDLLASMDFTVAASVLVLQQGVGVVAPARDGISTEDMRSQEMRAYLNKADHRTNINSAMPGAILF